MVFILADKLPALWFLSWWSFQVFATAQTLSVCSTTVRGYAHELNYIVSHDRDKTIENIYQVNEITVTYKWLRKNTHRAVTMCREAFVCDEWGANTPPQMCHSCTPLAWIDMTCESLEAKKGRNCFKELTLTQTWWRSQLTDSYSLTPAQFYAIVVYIFFF